MWIRENRGYERVPSQHASDIIKRHHFGEYLGFGGYVASAGTCKGDSGGPMYQIEIDPLSGQKKYIVTGENTNDLVVQYNDQGYFRCC